MTKAYLVSEETLRQALDALGECMSYMEAPTSTQPYVQTSMSVKQLRTILTKEPQEPVEYDLNKCPNCGGSADNGHDRCYPPNPYYCTKCMEELK